MNPVEGPVWSGGVALHVARLGRGPRALVLHGGPGLDHRTVLPLARRLAADAELWLPDLPGHGASRRPGETPPALDVVLEVTARWLDGFDRPWDAAIGHSLGAWVLADLLRRGRIRSAAVVLVAPPAGGPEAGRTPLRGAFAVARRRRRGGDVEPLRRDLVDLVADETGRPPSEDFVACIRAARLRAPLDYALLLRQLHRRLLEGTRPWTPPCPTLVLCGRDDGVTPVDQARRVAAGVTGATFREVDGGHFPFAHDDADCAEAALGFLRPIWGGRDAGDQARRSRTQ